MASIISYILPISLLVKESAILLIFWRMTKSVTHKSLVLHESVCVLKDRWGLRSWPHIDIVPSWKNSRISQLMQF